MSNSSEPRVVRKHRPKKHYTAATYRKALPKLLEDFGERCAYSLVHAKTIHDREMHVDHHDPRKKRKCGYDNLFPAYGCCNGAKGDTWPSKEDIALGARFLNPCKESDYAIVPDGPDGVPEGAQIFEDPATHELVGTTVAARYHIEMLDLNHPALVHQRRERTVMWNLLKQRPIVRRGKGISQPEGLTKIMQVLGEIANLKVPIIAPPPQGSCS